MTDAVPQPPAPEAPAPRRRRWLVPALVVSLCVNLLVVGGAAGFAWRAMGPGSLEMPAGFDRTTIWRVAHDLSDEDREAARRAVHDEMPRLRELRGRRQDARREIAARLEEAPLDQTALRAALSEARERERAARDVVDDAFVRFVAGLAPEGRTAIAEALRRKPHRGWGRRHD